MVEAAGLAEVGRAGSFPTPLNVAELLSALSGLSELGPLTTLTFAVGLPLERTALAIWAFVRVGLGGGEGVSG